MDVSHAHHKSSKINKKSIIICLAWTFVALGIVFLITLFTVVGINILKKRDPTSVCEDFYVHTCAKVFPTNSNTSNEEKDNNDLNDLIRKNIDKVQFNDNEFSTMIDACMDTDTIYSRGLKPLRDLLASLGGLPTNRNREMKTTMEMMGLVTRTLSTNGLFKVFVVPNFLGSMENVLFLSTVVDFVASPTPYPIPLVPKLEIDQIDDIKQIIFNIFKMLDSENELNNKTVEEDVAYLVYFWFEVNEINVTPIKNDWQLMNIKTLSEITGLDWLSFFQSCFCNQHNITLNNEIIVHEKSKLLATVKSIFNACDSPRTLLNYAIFQGIRPLLMHTTLAMQTLCIQLDKMVTFHSIMSWWLLTRKRMCYRTGVQQLPYHATRDLYGDLYTDDDIKALFTIFETIKEAFYMEMSRNKWLNRQSKQKLLNKLEKMQFDLLYPEIVANCTLLKNVYDFLPLSNATHFENVLMTTTIQRHLVLSKLYNNPKSEQIWIMPPATTSAWNLHYKNKIQLPIGLLLYKNYNSKLNLVEQYSDIGFVIAHEIAHGFDSTGIRFDENGRIVDSVLDEQSRKIFNDKLEFLVRQYDKFCPSPDLCVDGKKSLDENIADVIGVKMAYLGFIKALEIEEERNKKFDNNFTPFTSPDVQFFYYYAKKFCIGPNLDFVKWILKYSQHSPNDQRVNGPLSNMKEFSYVFQCHWINSMNPVIKFTLW